jgi:hypothetical protein
LAGVGATGEGALGALGGWGDIGELGDVEPPRAGDRVALISRPPNTAPATPETPPVATTEPKCAALFMGATAAETDWWPSNAASAKCPPVKVTIFMAISGLKAAMNNRPTPPIRLATPEATLVAPAPCSRWNPVMRTMTRITLEKMSARMVSLHLRTHERVAAAVAPARARGAITVTTTMSTRRTTRAK